jgi:hypothetical protein
MTTEIHYEPCAHDVRVNGGVGPQFLVVITCEQGHEDRVRYRGEQEPVVRFWAGLMDGSSYPVPPGPDSPLCKCGLCGAQLRADVLALGPQGIVGSTS